MKFLFLHQNFPAQFRHLAAALAQDPANQVVFATQRETGKIPGVRKLLYRPSRQPHPKIHHYVRPLETAVLEGQAVYRLLQDLKQQGFYPDVVYAHSGWGPGLFVKDIYPRARSHCYFEWFYHARGSDADFDPSDPLDANAEAKIRVKNAPILLDLYSCDRGLSPTRWQWQQFPPEFRSKITVLHDGVDTDFFQPQPGAKLVLPRLQLDLSHVNELVTYVAHGMEPYRGFPQFMHAIALLQQRRPHCHAVVVGEDRVAYGKSLPDGKTYKQAMLEQLDLDPSRLHFTGLLPYAEYRQVLQASSVHIYLTRPFVLSWSMLEAMSTGCVILGSRTAPVQEAIADGENGFLIDFFDPEQIAARASDLLDRQTDLAVVQQHARETILANYNLETLLAQHIHLVKTGSAQ